MEVSDTHRLGTNVFDCKLRQNYLSKDLTEKAYTVFKAYCQSDGRSLDNCLDTDQVVDINEIRMNSAQLRLCLEGMGLAFTEIQVKDMLYGMLQTADTLTYNQLVCGNDESILSGDSMYTSRTSRTARSITTSRTKNAGSVLSGGMSESNAGSMASARSSASRRKIGKEISLTFSQFIDLLTVTMEDCNAEEELQHTFEAMDKDKDGVIGVSDARSLLSSSVFVQASPENKPSNVVVGNDSSQQAQQSTPTQHPASKNSRSYRDEEIEVMLEQVDWDTNGQVTLEDLRRTLDVN